MWLITEWGLITKTTVDDGGLSEKLDGWYDLACVSVKQTVAHDGSTTIIPNECYHQGWPSMKQTTVHDGGSSNKPVE